MRKHKQGSVGSKEMHRRTDIAVLKEGQAGAKVAELCRRYGMSGASYYNWKARYAGMTVSDLRRLKALETERGRLKQIEVDTSLAGRRAVQVLERLAESRG